MRTRSNSKCTLAFFLAVILTGCATAHVTTPSGFLRDYSNLQEGFYFKQERIVPGVSFSDFSGVKVAPVNLSYLDDKTACDTTELEDLAHQFRAEVEQKLSEAGFDVGSNPYGKTLVVSLALTNVEPPQALMNAGLTAASLVTHIPLPFDKDGTTAFEGKITEGTTGKVLVEFAEKRSGSGDELDVKAMTVGNFGKFTNTQAVFKGWADNTAKMLADLRAGKGPSGTDKAARKSKRITKQVIGLAL